MKVTQLHDDDFFKVLWDESARIIGIDWKEGTSAMTDEQFKAELTLFAGLVEQKRRNSCGCQPFSPQTGAGIQLWR